MRFRLFLIYVFIAPLISISQNDTTLVKQLNEKGWSFLRENVDSSIYYSNQALKLAEKCNWLIGVSKSYHQLAWMYYTKSDYRNAIELANKAVELRLNESNKNNLAKTYNNLGVFYMSLGDYNKAVSYSFKCLGIQESLKDKKGVGITKNNLASNYMLIGKGRESLAFGKSAFENSLSVGDSLNMGHSMANLALAYKNLGKYDSALFCTNEALTIYKSIDYLSGVAKMLSQNAAIYLSWSDSTLIRNKYFSEALLDSGIYNNLQSLKIRQEIGDLQGLAFNYGVLGSTYIRKNNTSKAKAYLLRGFKLCDSLQYYSIKIDFYRPLMDVYSLLGDFKSAYYYATQYINDNNKIIGEEAAKKLYQAKLDYAFDKKAATDSLKNEEKITRNKLENEAALKHQRIYTYTGIVGFALMLFVALVSYRAYRNKKTANKIIKEQKDIVELQKNELVSSISYAKRIQYALLAQNEIINEVFPDHFILFAPKDIVSGDFYWVHEGQNAKGEKLFYLAVCDSTGHGVPGAFMSLLNISFLNEAVNEKNILEPNEIFDYVRQKLVQSISKEGQKDGFDGVLICLNLTTGKFTYSAANNSILHVSKNSAAELPKDRMPVGDGENKKTFSHFEFIPQKGDCIYLYSDGFPDQFGGPKGKKFKSKKLNELLLSISGKPTGIQKELLETEFKKWKGNMEQVDDVCIIGIHY